MVHEVTGNKIPSQMEGDVTSLRLELEGARKALNLQTTRCKQIVAAFTKKLEDKEKETKNMRLLRDQQLNEVVRALMVLEARLRREQRNIRSLLGERDAMIRSQQLEIARLKKALDAEYDTVSSAPATSPLDKVDCDVKPDLISSLGITEFNRENTDVDEESNVDSLQLSLCQSDSLLSDLSTQSFNGDALEMFEPVKTANSENNPEKHKPPPLSFVTIKNNLHDEKFTILTPVKEESSSYYSPWKSEYNKNAHNDNTIATTDIEQKKTEIKPTPSTLLQEVRIGSNKNEYEDNPVLNCVNQILLRDQEEFLEEQRALRLKEQERNKLELKQQSEENTARKLTFEEKNVLPNKVESKNGYKEEIKDKYQCNLQQKNTVPPALPPKPSRLTKNLDSRLPLDSVQKKVQNNRMELNRIEIVNKRTSLPNPSSDNELYVISNSAIDDALLERLQGRKGNCVDFGIGLKRALSAGEGLFPASHVVHHPTHKSQQKLSGFKPLDLEVQKGYMKEKSPVKPCVQTGPSKKSPTIKVASPVASLIATVDNVVQEEPRKETSPSVSQIVRRFEDLGTKKEPLVESGDDTLSKNFEEFRLDDCDMETLCGGLEDGDLVKQEVVEKKAEESAEVRVSYENFLEATGLSQKSIMTPSRMFSNHKSVMKPKDVKHRNRVKAAAVIERCLGNPHALTGSTVKYWTEPFL
uniref:Lebercilin domain-containing protein n=1 Tax=Clastoptera arizonana TaxID=38151 RepID=A0A1B6DFP2_9HEMI